MSAVASSSAVAAQPIGLTSAPAAVPAAAEPAPAAALDKVAEPSILDKAREMAKPYLDQVDKTARPLVEKVQSTTRPYTDAALAKGKELVDKIEGNTASPVVAQEKAAETAEGAAATTEAKTADIADQAKAAFQQGLTTVQSTFGKITSTIDAKTASGDKPGLVTQLSQAVHTGIEKFDKALNDTPPKVPTDSALGATSEHPIPTTTNTVPHVTTAL
ncbi:hypothetical protein Q5752_002900 [Cryptotrichosporon argae]